MLELCVIAYIYVPIKISDSLVRIFCCQVPFQTSSKSIRRKVLCQLRSTVCMVGTTEMHSCLLCIIWITEFRNTVASCDIRLLLYLSLHFSLSKDRMQPRSSNW